MVGSNLGTYLHRSNSESERLLSVELSRRLSEDSMYNKELCSSWQSGFNISSIVVGTGILNLPIALVETSGLGVFLMMIVCVLQIYTSNLLLKCIQFVKWNENQLISYGELGYQTFGTVGKWIVNLLVHVSLVASASGYLILAASNLSWILGIKYIKTLTLISTFVWPHVFIKTMRGFSILSALNLGIAFWIEAVVVADAIYPSQIMKNSTEIHVLHLESSYHGFDLSSNEGYMKFSYSFILFGSAFFCHAALPTIYENMKNKKNANFTIASTLTGVLLMLYIPICVVSFAVYGQQLKTPVFMNMRNSMVREVTILLFTIHVLLSYTITLYPVQRALEYFVLCETNCGEVQTPSPSTTTSDKTFRIWCRTIVVVITMGISILVQKFPRIVFLFIANPVGCLACIFPPLFYLKLYWKQIEPLSKCCHGLLVLIGIWFMISGFLATLNSYLEHPSLKIYRGDQ